MSNYGGELWQQIIPESSLEGLVEGEERIVRGTLMNIKQKCQDAKIGSQAMIIVSPTLGARYWTELKKSKLYDEGFSHRFRKLKIK